MHKYPSLDADEAVYGMILFCANLITKGYRQLISLQSVQHDPDLLSSDELKAIQATLSKQPTHREIFPRTFDFLAERAGKRLWVEKTPDHTQQAKRILSELPSAKAIELVRDARDILSSKKLREQRLYGKIRDNTATELDTMLLGSADYDTFWNGLAWKTSINAMNQAKASYQDRILTIRYEDLTSQSEATVRKICEFLEIPFVPEMMDADQENVAERDKQETKVGTGILSTSIGRWKSTLSPGEKALANRLLRVELQQHGYQVPALSTLDRVRSIWTLIRSLPKLFIRIWNKLKHKGVRHTVDSWKNYIRRILPVK